MKFVFQNGIVFLDTEPYGILNVTVDDGITDADVSDSLSGGNFESITGAKKVRH